LPNRPLNRPTLVKENGAVGKFIYSATVCCEQSRALMLTNSDKAIMGQDQKILLMLHSETAFYHVNTEHHP